MGVPYLGDEWMREHAQQLTDEQELLTRLRVMSGEIGPILQALVNAVTVVGYDHTRAALEIISRRPPGLVSYGGLMCAACRKPTPIAMLYRDEQDGLLYCGACHRDKELQRASHARTVAALQRELCQGTPAWRAVGNHGVRICAGCQAVIADCNEPFKRNGKDYCKPACYYREPAARRWTWEAPDPLVETPRSYTLYEEMGSPPLYREGRHLERALEAIRPKVERALDRVVENAAGEWHGVEYTPPTVFCEAEGCFQDHLPSLRYCQEHYPAALAEQRAILASDATSAAPGGPPYQDVIDPATAKRGVDLYALAPEPEVTEAVTDEVAAAMAAGDVVEAQRLILAGLDNVGEQEAVHVPPRAPVMPMPRAGSRTPTLDRLDAYQPVERAATGKPCCVCMRDAYHIHAGASGKPRHYCDAHAPGWRDDE